jgi:hypothetical protein
MPCRAATLCSVATVPPCNRVALRCNRLALRCNRVALRCNRVALAALQPCCDATVMCCVATMMHCDAIALHLRCNRVATALQLDRVAADAPDRVVRILRRRLGRRYSAHSHSALGVLRAPRSPSTRRSHRRHDTARTHARAQTRAHRRARTQRRLCACGRTLTHTERTTLAPASKQTNKRTNKQTNTRSDARHGPEARRRFRQAGLASVTPCALRVRRVSTQSSHVSTQSTPCEYAQYPMRVRRICHMSRQGAPRLLAPYVSTQTTPRGTLSTRTTTRFSAFVRRALLAWCTPSTHTGASSAHAGCSEYSHGVL